MPSRDELIAGLKQGDAEALAQFIETHKPQLLAYIQKQLGTALRRKVEAEDLLQETAAEAVRCLKEADLSERDPFGWLCQIAQRRTIDAHRRFFGAQKRNAGREVGLVANADDSQRGNLIDMLVATMTTASKVYSRNHREAKLKQALAELPKEYRQALELRYLSGLPSKEIAEQMGKTDGAVRVMLTRSLSKLQQLMGPDEGP